MGTAAGLRSWRNWSVSAAAATATMNFSTGRLVVPTDRRTDAAALAAAGGAAQATSSVGHRPVHNHSATASKVRDRLSSTASRPR